MEIVFLAPGSSIHAIRWANAIVSRGHKVHFITMHEFVDDLDEKIVVHELPFSASLGYIANKFSLEKIVNKIAPDLIHVHQASGHGFLATISNISPTLLSIYGWEVYDAPSNKISNFIVNYSLRKTDYLASTSIAMKEQTKNIYPNLKKDITVTPFGVDLNKFAFKESNTNNKKITIGIVKKLEEKYGVKYLIYAFKKLLERLKKEEKNGLLNKIELIIVGPGSQKSKLEILTDELEIAKKTEFIGRVLHKEVPNWLNKFDIYCAPSILDSESFGVAIIEASACGLPVIVTNVGGLPEVVDDRKTGYVVPKQDADSLAEKLYKLVLDPNKRKKMGLEGRKKVKRLYNWDDNVDDMIKLYQEIISD